jgi:hypothetical protein
MAPEQRLERWARIVDAREYLRAIADERRVNPGEDMVSTMMAATDENGEPALTSDQAVTHLTELIFAGTDTTANLMGALVRLFQSHPDQLELVRADPSLWPAAIEEGLRLRSAANGLFRITTRDVEVAGETIPAKSIVWLALASANHDPERFDEPETFDIRRQEVDDHIAFGKGRHFCMGAPLTRVEAPIGLRVLYERIPELRVEEDQVFEYDPVLVAVILKHLQVSW